MNINPSQINLNDVTTPIPTVHSADVSQTDVDVTKIDRATLKQLRKNVEKLKMMKNIDAMKTVSHFDIRSFFPVSKK
jgi:hypothetical protein